MLNLVLALALLQGPQSVYRVSAAVDISVTVGAGLVLAVPNFYADRLIKPSCPCDPRAVNAFDRGAIGNKSAIAGRLSDVTVGVVTIAPLVLDAFDLGLNETWTEDAVVFAQTLAVNGALVTVTKYLVQRPLPRTYAGDPGLIDKPAGYRSFYSGHASTAFAALSATAMTIRLRYGEQTWPWIMTAVIGGSVAVERVADGRHFPTDVLVGALVGTAVGIAVPSLHSRGTPQGGAASPSRRGSFALGWRLRF